MTVIAGFLEILADWVFDKFLRGVAGRLFPSREVTSSLQAISGFTEGRLDPRTAEMPILGQIPRAELDLLRRSLEDNRATLVIGEGGTGKTGMVTALSGSSGLGSGIDILSLPTTPARSPSLALSQSVVTVQGCARLSLSRRSMTSLSARRASPVSAAARKTVMIVARMRRGSS